MRKLVFYLTPVLAALFLFPFIPNCQAAENTNTASILNLPLQAGMSRQNVCKALKIGNEADCQALGSARGKALKTSFLGAKCEVMPLFVETVFKDIFYGQNEPAAPAFKAFLKNLGLADKPWTALKGKDGEIDLVSKPYDVLACLVANGPCALMTVKKFGLDPEAEISDAARLTKHFGIEPEKARVSLKNNVYYLRGSRPDELVCLARDFHAADMPNNLQTDDLAKRIGQLSGGILSGHAGVNEAVLVAGGGEMIFREGQNGYYTLETLKGPIFYLTPQNHIFAIETPLGGTAKEIEKTRAKLAASFTPIRKNTALYSLWASGSNDHAFETGANYLLLRENSGAYLVIANRDELEKYARTR